jgi:hypothetical protein
MDSLFTTFLLFIAAITALISYLIIPHIPVVALMSAAAIALAAGVWWHWTQFSIEYRLSTWQEQLRNYASYAILLVVILLSYAFYIFGWGGISGYVARAGSSIREVGRRATSQVVGGVAGASRALANTGSALFSESAAEGPEEEEEEEEQLI